MKANQLERTLNDGTKNINGRLILLAEDDIDDQELLTDAINNLDSSIKVYAISNGNKAVAYLEALKDEALPQLIVLDYNLPEMNGEEILEKLSKNKRYDIIPKIVWSTSNSALYKTKCLQLGAKAYMVKPSDFSGIEDLAKQMLEFCTTSN